METTLKRTKKILMVVAARNFRDEEFFEPKEEFEKKGFQVVVCSSVTGNIKGALGKWVRAEIQLVEARDKDYSAVVFVGGEGAKEYFENKSAIKLAKSFFEKGKVLSAICIAPCILANAEILYNRRATCYFTEKEHLEKKGAIFVEEGVVRDENIITAMGPQYTKEFARAIINAIS